MTFCHQLALMADPTMSGSMTARLRIDTKGNVEDATAESVAISTTVADCITTRLRRLRFPAPPLTTTLWVPLTFETK